MTSARKTMRLAWLGCASGLWLWSLTFTVMAQYRAQDRPSYRIDAWTINNGLPQNGVHSLWQTRDGYLWMTTVAGLVRFDGVRFTVFDRSNTKALTSDRFDCVYEDGEGTLWAGMRYGGLLRYRNSVATALTMADGLPDLQVWGIYAAPDGGLLLQTGAGPFVMRHGQFSPGQHPHTQAGPQGVRAANGARWRLTPEAVLRVVQDRAHTAQLAEYFQDERGSMVEFIAEGKLSFEDRHGNLWAARRRMNSFG